MTRDFTTNRARVLIAEDHALVREGLRAVLSGEPDLEVVGEAENGKRALELCRSLSPELVLMDVRMPEMDGLEATRKIKEAQPEVMVLMVTTHQDPDYLLEAVRSGAAGYILKEATQPELLSAVRRTLSGESALNQDLAMRLITRLSGEPSRDRERTSEAAGGGSQVPERVPEALAGILSVRETEALRLIASGKTNRQIAQELMVSLSTVKTYVQRIINKPLELPRGGGQFSLRHRNLLYCSSLVVIRTQVA
jgi:two-component system, NarL family, response regulator LiaR